jgi:hypothetical protein
MMKTKWAVLLLAVFCGVTLMTGCGGGDGNASSSNGGTNQPPAATNSLAGKTLTFTVTGSVNFSEPVGAVYMVAYPSETAYVFTPSPMNRETTQQELGSYTFNPATGAIHYTRPDHQDLDGVFHFDSATTGTLHLNGPEGEVEDATFVAQ